MGVIYTGRIICVCGRCCFFIAYQLNVAKKRLLYSIVFHRIAKRGVFGIFRIRAFYWSINSRVGLGRRNVTFCVCNFSKRPTLVTRYDPFIRRSRVPKAYKFGKIGQYRFPKHSNFPEHRLLRQTNHDEYRRIRPNDDLYCHFSLCSLFLSLSRFVCLSPSLCLFLSLSEIPKRTTKFSPILDFYHAKNRKSFAVTLTTHVPRP